VEAERDRLSSGLVAGILPRHRFYSERENLPLSWVELNHRPISLARSR
jgi:hypothetical protein